LLDLQTCIFHPLKTSRAFWQLLQPGLRCMYFHGGYNPENVSNIPGSELEMIKLRFKVCTMRTGKML
jgi:hypothetical protein